MLELRGKNRETRTKRCRTEAATKVRKKNILFFIFLVGPPIIVVIKGCILAP